MSKNISKKIGNLGESIAKKYLLQKGYKILEQKYFKRIGEIDLIALHTKEIVFFEIKTRTNCKFGSIFESVSKNQKERIIKTSLKFFHENEKYSAFSWRIDLIAIKLNLNKRKAKIIHLKNAFI